MLVCMSRFLFPYACGLAATADTGRSGRLPSEALATTFVLLFPYKLYTYACHAANKHPQAPILRMFAKQICRQRVSITIEADSCLHHA